MGEMLNQSVQDLSEIIYYFIAEYVRRQHPGEQS
jgi:hypothetical protein